MVALHHQGLTWMQLGEEMPLVTILLAPRSSAASATAAAVIFPPRRVHVCSLRLTYVLACARVLCVFLCVLVCVSVMRRVCVPNNSRVSSIACAVLPFATAERISARPRIDPRDSGTTVQGGGGGKHCWGQPTN